MIAATDRKIRGSISHRGSPFCWSEPKKMSPLPERSITTGNAVMNPVKNASITGDQRKRSGGLRARRNPTPMPRKLPSRTKFEKYDR